MAYQDQFYTVGTVTVTNGSTAVTGAGTGWETALIVGGVFYAGGGAYPIQSVSGETELTLAIPYVGVDAAGVGYAIDRQRAAAISNIAMNDRLAQIIREISIGNIEELNALELVANRSLTTDEAGNLALTKLGALGRALLALASGETTQYVRGDGTLQPLNSLPFDIEIKKFAPNLKLSSTGGTNSYDINANISDSADGGVNIKRNGTNIINFGVGGVSLRTYGTAEIANNLTVGTSSNNSRIYMNNSRNARVAEIGPGVGTGNINILGFVNSTAGGFYFVGNSSFTGTLSKGGGTFLIDHPLFSLYKTKNLRHGFVESTEYLNIYRGEVRLVNGRATVNIDEFFGMTVGTFWALNADITVSSLQNQESFDRLKPGAALDSGTFEIVCENENSNDLVSWMVTGRRKDPFVLHLDPNCERGTGKLIPEFDKPEYVENAHG